MVVLLPQESGRTHELRRQHEWRLQTRAGVAARSILEHKVLLARIRRERARAQEGGAADGRDRPVPGVAVAAVARRLARQPKAEEILICEEPPS